MNRERAIAFIFGVIATIILPSCSVPSISALERSDVSKKAQQFTVQIDGEESGTGVIIEKMVILIPY